VFAFFRESFEPAARRLKALFDKAAIAGAVADDAATGQALLSFVGRGFNCGALSESEAAATGLSMQELTSGSFARILEERTATETR